MSLMEDLARQLGGADISGLSRQLGADDDTVGKAIAGALPMLFGALAQNSAREDGASALAAAIDRDHDGSVLNDLNGFLGGRNTASLQAGPKILGHVFGQRRATAETSLSRSTGLDAASTAKLMAMLAPLVMGALGKAKQQQRLDPRGLSDVLRDERRTAAAAKPEMGMLGNLLDQDNDGQVFDDIAKAGAGFLGRLMRR